MDELSCLEETSPDARCFSCEYRVRDTVLDVVLEPPELGTIVVGTADATIDVQTNGGIAALGDPSAVLDLSSSVLLGSRNPRIDGDFAHLLEQQGKVYKREGFWNGFQNQLLLKYSIQGILVRLE